jgi:hypothetical protein
MDCSIQARVVSALRRERSLREAQKWKTSMLHPRPNLLPYIVAICLSLLVLAGRGWSADIRGVQPDRVERVEGLVIVDGVTYSGAGCVARMNLSRSFITLSRSFIIEDQSESKAFYGSACLRRRMKRKP